MNEAELGFELKVALARIEALEAALLEIEKLEDLDAFTMQDIARAALAPEPDIGCGKSVIEPWSAALAPEPDK